MKMKRLLAVLLIGTMLMSVLGGCGTKKDEKTDGSTSKGDVTENSTDKVELFFMHNLLPETEGGAAIAFRNGIDKVKADHPDLVINEEALASDSYHTKIKTLAAGNELPDIFVIRGSMLDMLIENGLVTSIDEELNTDQAWKNGFLPGAFDVFRRGDKVYGVPLSAKTTSLVYYNEAILKESGVEEFPHTFEEFKDAVRKIKEAGYTPISLGNKAQWVAQSCILSTLADRFTGTDWFMSIKNGDGAKFTDEEFVAALKGLKDLADLGAFNTDSSSIDNMQQKTPYYNKQAAMFIEGAWAIGNVTADAPEDVLAETKLALLPPVEGAKGKARAFSGGASIAYVLNSNLSGEKRELAIEVLKALSDGEYGKTMTEHNKFSAVKPAQYDQSQLSDLTLQYMDLAEETVFTPVYDIHLTPSVIEVINSGLQELIIGMVTPEELAEKIQKEYEKSMEQ